MTLRYSKPASRLCKVLIPSNLLTLGIPRNRGDPLREENSGGYRHDDGVGSRLSSIRQRIHDHNGHDLELTNVSTDEGEPWVIR
jgi:hypothetical protein